MAVLLLLGGVILLVLGLVGEYVGRIFMCTNATPQYVIRSMITSREQDKKLMKQSGILVLLRCICSF